MNKIKTIGFFGDSFCAEYNNFHSKWKNYKTYIELLSAHYDAEVVGLGLGGSSVWDALMLQLDPLIKENRVPDVCVFVWTTPDRLFHRSVRRINCGDAMNPKLHTFNPFDWKIWRAAKYYYQHLWDVEQHNLSYKAILHYVDTVIIPQLPKGTKVINLWSMGQAPSWENDGFHPKKVDYLHNWTNGVEIKPPLLSVSIADSDLSILQVDKRANHLEGVNNNQLIFEWIKNAIDNYENGNKFDYSDQVAELWPKTL
jgi:hypothetical protein